MGQLSFFPVPMQQGYMSHLLLQHGYTRGHFVDYSCLEEFWYDSHMFAISTAVEAEAQNSYFLQQSLSQKSAFIFNFLAPSF